MNELSIPSKRLACTQFFNYSIIGITAPYWPLYLESLGYAASEIGIFTAVFMITKVGLPNFLGWLGDKTQAPVYWLKVTALACLLISLLFFHFTSFWGLLFVVGIFGAVWSSVTALVESTTLQFLRDHPHQYGTIRLWGSVGFIVSSIGTGYCLEPYGVKVIISLLVVCNIFQLLMAASLPAVAYVDTKQKSGEHFWGFVFKPEILLFCAIIFLIFASHGPYYTFYSVHLESYDYSRGTIGILWALGVFVEVLIFMISAMLVERFSLRQLMLTTMLLTAFRWWLIGALPEQLSLMILAQCLHAISFGLFHVIAIRIIHRYFPHQFLGQAQALYSSLGFGVGTTAGCMMSGLLWDQVGSYLTFIAASLVVLLAGILAFSPKLGFYNHHD